MPSVGDYKPGSVVVGHLHSGASIAGSFATSLDRLCAADDRVLFPPIRNQCNTDLAAGRNQVVAAFLNQTPGEWLLFVDDDMGFAPDLVDKLLMSAHPEHRPVVGALCFAYRRYENTAEGAQRFVIRPTIYRFVETETTIGYAAVDEYERESLVQVDATGTGCVLIHRRLLEEMQAEIGPNWFTSMQVNKGPSGVTVFSEDLSFFARLRGAGVPIFVNTSAKTSHRKPIYLDEWYFDHQPVRNDPPTLAIIGTGHSASQFIAQALSSCGVVVGHEQWWNLHGVRAPGLTGDSSWIATHRLDDFDGKVWHQVRHPLLVIRSMLSGPMFDDDPPAWVVPYEAERRAQAGYSLDDAPEVKVLRVVAHWWQTAEKHAERTWRVESITPGYLLELADAMGVSVDLKFCRAVLDRHGTETNKHTPGSTVRWCELPDGPDKALIEDMAREFGYEEMEVD